MSTSLLELKELSSDETNLMGFTNFLKEVLLSNDPDLKKIKEKLTKNELIVLKKRFAIDEEKSYYLHEVAKTLDVSNQRIRQIQISAIQKLKGGIEITNYLKENPNFSNKEKILIESIFYDSYHRYIPKLEEIYKVEKLFNKGLSKNTIFDMLRNDSIENNYDLRAVIRGIKTAKKNSKVFLEELKELYSNVRTLKTFVEIMLLSDDKDLKYIRAKLEPVQIMVLKERFGIDNNERGPHYLHEVGKILNSTSERVRQIEMKALRKLRKNIDLIEHFKENTDFTNEEKRLIEKIFDDSHYIITTNQIYKIKELLNTTKLNNREMFIQLYKENVISDLYSFRKAIKIIRKEL